MKTEKKGLEKREVGTSVRDKLLVETRRNQIIQAANEMFTRKGFHQTTIKDICEAPGLGPGTLYNYIHKKEDILYLVYDKLTTMLNKPARDLIEGHEIEPLDQLKDFLRETIDIVWDNQELILLMDRETAALDKESLYTVLKKESKYVRYVEEILARAKETGAIQNTNTEIAANIIAYLLAFIALRRWNLKNRFNEQEIKSGLVDFIMRALCITDARKKSR
jgi:AcrR family transcriptional regulator